MEQLIHQLTREPGKSYDRYVSDETEELACDWFVDLEAKEEVTELLERFQLDESAIEAAAVQNALSEIECLDRRLTSLQASYRKTLRSVAQYCDTLARRLRETADRILADEHVIQLGDESNTTPLPS
jgi:hypothetical protein